MKGCLRLLIRGLFAVVVVVAGLAWLGSRLPDPEPEPAVEPYRPTFTTLRLAPDDGQGPPELDLSGLGSDERRLGRDLRAGRFPTHACRPPVDGPNTHAWTQQHGQDYANCLLDAWRPWLEEHGVRRVTPVVLRHCSLAPWATTPACTGGDGVSWQPDEGIYHLHDGFGPDRWGDADAAHLLARTAARTLQAQVGLDADRPVLVAGVRDEEKAQRRREALQVDCLAAGMLAASQDPESRRLATELRQRARRDGDAAQAFWLGQSARGIVGECDAVAAAPELVRGSR